MSKTPERIRYETLFAKIDENCQATNTMLNELLTGAAAAGVVATVHVESLQPLAMGNYRLTISTWPTLAARKYLDELEAAAIRSES